MKVVFCFWPETSHILPHYEYGDFLILMSERVYFYFGFCSAFFQWSLRQNYSTFGHLGVTSVNGIWLKINPLIGFDWIFCFCFGGQILVDANEIRSVPFLKNLLMVKDVPPLR
jgi:hypothetical protein